MRITIAAIGRLKAGPARDLTAAYLDRAEAAGRKAALTFTVREFAEGRAGSAGVRRNEEARALLGAVPPRAVLVALDESGKSLDSRAFADLLSGWRDSGKTDAVLAIGGADGHGKDLVDRADIRLAFGAMTWPHQLVRIMLAEQLYRAVTILSGHPYHRD
jgi:23S rRNA (pseudouridine1915-N3)-methyltransferase